MARIRQSNQTLFQALCGDYTSCVIIYSYICVYIMYVYVHVCMHVEATKLLVARGQLSVLFSGGGPPWFLRLDLSLAWSSRAH